MAERVGFEPTLPFRVNTLSKRAPSATRPSLPRQNLLQPATPWEANAGVSQSAAKCTANRVPFDSMVRAAETARHRLGNSLPECHPEPSRPDGRQYFSRNSWQACKSDAEVVRRAITDPFVGAFVPAFEHGSGLGGQVFGGSPLVRSDGLDPAAESSHAIPNRAEPRPLQSIRAVCGESREPSLAKEESKEEREIGGWTEGRAR